MLHAMAAGSTCAKSGVCKAMQSKYPQPALLCRDYQQDKTIAQLSSEYEVHSNQITQWKKRLIQESPNIFSGKRKKAIQDEEKLQDELYQQIGRLKVELDWLKKNINSLIDERRRCIDPNYPQISIARQCELLSVPRSAYYYKPCGENTYSKQLMRLIDEEHTRHPFYGTRRLTAWLRRNGHEVNHKRISRLMHKMGIQAIYPKPNLSNGSKEHKKYPYLLKGLKIDHPNQVWSTDITYIRMKHGFVYLAAVIDWFSRYVLSFQVSTTLDRDFCVKALKDSLAISIPEIFNTDQGSQFTSEEFTGCLKEHNIDISMDGRGRALDNIFVERLSFRASPAFQSIPGEAHMLIWHGVESPVFLPWMGCLPVAGVGDFQFCRRLQIKSHFLLRICGSFSCQYWSYDVFHADRHHF